MLGVRLDEETERALEEAARAEGSTKSGLARSWILEKLAARTRSTITAEDLAAWQKPLSASAEEALSRATEAWLEALDAEDGGYDWGPAGPPV